VVPSVSSLCKAQDGVAKVLYQKMKFYAELHKPVGLATIHTPVLENKKKILSYIGTNGN
jgi:hypothetical protein